MSKKQKQPKDPLIEAQIDRTLAQYQGVAAPHMLRKMREELRDLLTKHPVGVGLMEQHRKHAPPLSTGIEVKEGVNDDDDEAGGGEEGS